MTKFLVVLAALVAAALAQNTTLATGNTTAVNATTSSSSSAAATTDHQVATSTTATVVTTEHGSGSGSGSSSAVGTTQQPSLATGSTSGGSSSSVATTGMPVAYGVTVQAWTDLVNGTCSGANGTSTLTMLDNVCGSFQYGVFGAFNGSARAHFFNNTVTLSVYQYSNCITELASEMFMNGQCKSVTFSGYGSRLLTISWGAATSSSSSSSGSGSGSTTTTGDVGAGSAVVPSLLAMLFASVFFFAL